MCEKLARWSISHFKARLSFFQEFNLPLCKLPFNVKLDVNVWPCLVFLFSPAGSPSICPPCDNEMRTDTMLEHMCASEFGKYPPNMQNHMHTGALIRLDMYASSPIRFHQLYLPLSKVKTKCAKLKCSLFLTPLVYVVFIIWGKIMHASGLSGLVDNDDLWLMNAGH